MADLKHVGKIKHTGKKVLVAFRTLPGDAYSCLVVPTESLLDDQHNSLIQLVESPAAQQAFEFHEVLARAKFPDGSTMLPTLHVQGKLLKVGTDKVEMTPNFNVSISLAELNQLIAEQKGIAVSELAVQDPSIDPNVKVEEVATVKDMNPAGRTTSASVNEDAQPVIQAPAVPLTPEDQAKKFRSDADRLSKEAAELRRQAEALVPTTKKKKEAVSE
jgi:hypothetical protein